MQTTSLYVRSIHTYFTAVPVIGKPIGNYVTLDVSHARFTTTNFPDGLGNQGKVVAKLTMHGDTAEI